MREERNARLKALIHDRRMIYLARTGTQRLGDLPV